MGALLVGWLGFAAAPASGQGPPPPTPEVGPAHSFDLRLIARGLVSPTWVGAVPGRRRALWVLEQRGRIVQIGGKRRRTVLDLRGRIAAGGERGLLGIAFHPRFRRNRRVYVHFTDRAGNTRVVEYRTNRRRTRIRRRTARRLLRVAQPYANHNGGTLAFGRDRRLYLGLGDGGAGGDPRRVAQDPARLLGKLIAARVPRRRPAWRVVLTGLRNPWRLSFDRGELWIGDVGEGSWEEINRVTPPASGAPPKNLGWSAYEGVVPLPGGDALRPGGEVVWPVAVYPHEGGNCSVTGGRVYRGRRVATLRGRYVFGDYCSGTLWSLAPTPDGRAADLRREQANLPLLVHIGADRRGELLLVAQSGEIYRAVAPRGG